MKSHIQPRTRYAGPIAEVVIRGLVTDAGLTGDASHRDVLDPLSRDQGDGCVEHAAAQRAIGHLT